MLHTFSTVHDVISVSYNLKRNLTLISLNLREPFTEYIGI